MHRRSIIFLATFLGLTFVFAMSADAAHKVLMQGNGKLAIVDAEGQVEWEMKWGGIHDIHVLPGGNIMVQHRNRKVVEIDQKTKKVVWSYDSTTQNGNQGKRIEVHAFQPLKNGRVMIADRLRKTSRLDSLMIRST